MSPGLVVGVDIGGTKTHLRAVRGGEVLADRVVPTSEWRPHSNREDAEALLALINEAAGTPAALGVGAHGCDTGAECAAFEEVLASLTPARVRVVNDAELLPPAVGLSEGIGVVAGTGSIAVARNGHGAMLVAGGWGWVFGEEGSAPGFVRDAIRAIRGVLDSGERTEGLYEALRRSTGAESVTEMARGIAKLGSATAVGEHAQAVFEAADTGSNLAVQVVRDGARSLVDLVERLISRGASSRDVVASGGVMASQPLLQDLFRQELGLRLREHRVWILTDPPVGGAVALATALLGGDEPGPRSSGKRAS